MQNSNEKEDARLYLRSVNCGLSAFLQDIGQIEELWQLYYSSDAEVNNPSNPTGKTFKEWLIHLTPDEFDATADRYEDETGFPIKREGRGSYPIHLEK